METCIFCDIQRGEPLPGGMVYGDDLVYAYHLADEDEQSTYLGHLVLVTRRHAADFTALTADEARAIGPLTAHLSSALKDCTGAEKVYSVFYGEVTPHLHVHLTARYHDAPKSHLRWNAENWPDAPRGNAYEVAALCQRLRSALAQQDI
jgi:histidine triad (HIT) family protein